MAFDWNSYVKSDHFKQVRRNYEAKRRKEHPEIYRARKIIHRLVRDGKIRKPTFCFLCLAKNHPIEAHHEDYSKPRRVSWVCRPCHIATHLGKTILRCPKEH